MRVVYAFYADRALLVTVEHEGERYSFERKTDDTTILRIASRGYGKPAEIRPIKAAEWPIAKYGFEVAFNERITP